MLISCYRYIYIHIHIYILVCVCMCVYIYKLLDVTSMYLKINK